MLPVSATFKNAVKAPVRQWKVTGTIDFYSNIVGAAGITAAADSVQDATFTPINSAKNGKTVASKRWALQDYSIIRSASFVTGSTNSRLTVADNPAIAVGGAVNFIFVVWVYFSQVSNMDIVNKWLVGQTEWRLQFNDTANRITGTVVTSGGTFTAIPAINIPTNTWILVALSFQPSLASDQLQVDVVVPTVTGLNVSQPTTTATTTATGTITATSASMNFGTVPGLGTTFVGRMMSAALFKSASSISPASIVGQHLNLGAPVPKCKFTSTQLANSTAFWNLDENSDGSAFVNRLDSVGTSHLAEGINKVPSGYGRRIGDVNNDGQVNSDDYNQINDWVALIGAPTAEQAVLADVNQSGVITAADASQVSNFYNEEKDFNQPTTLPGQEVAREILPAADVYPLDVPPAEVGWWGNEEADYCGYLTGTYYRLNYASPQRLSSVSWDSDAKLGFPTDFAIEYLSGSSAWTVIDSQVGNGDNSYSKAVPAVTATSLRIRITRIMYAKEYARLLEFTGSNSATIGSRILDFDVLKERQADNATLPIGNSSANSLTLTLDNINGDFTPTNAGSPYSSQLKGNRIITLRLGLLLPSGVYEYVPVGTYYTQRWRASTDKTKAMVDALDRAKLMNQQQYRVTTVLPATKLSTMVTQAATDFGLTSSDYLIDPTDDVLNFGWNPLQSYWQDVTDAAQAEGGAAYFDENNLFIFENKNHLSGSSSLITFTDDDGYIALQEEWNEDLIRNRVIIQANPYLSGSSATIWDNQDSWSIPAGGTVTIPVNFNAVPSVNTTASSFALTTSGAGVSVQSWTPYSYGGTLVLQNTAGVARTVTRITCTGTPLVVAGPSYADISDSASISDNGEKVYPLNGNRLIQLNSMAVTLATRLKNVWADPKPPVLVAQNNRGRPEMQLADRVTVNSTRLNLNRDYFITRIRLHFDGTLSGSMDLLDAAGF